MTSAQLDRSPGRPLRTAALGGLAFIPFLAALVAVLSLAIRRAGLARRWLGVAGLVAAAVFLLGSVLSVLGPTPEGNGSLIGAGLFVVWMLVLSAGLWRAASRDTAPG